ncbi:hypothetical protein Acr_00g0012250 [Actinidia rufa]|uniref:Uncharacterized protein n=1 Tax=Actinidia rufa TaxID=165716 RepID=A0A7J0DBD1_9ERIC|nr:hypothetical protein Acr_00g0012250 [Actinidia rufa]
MTCYIHVETINEMRGYFPNKRRCPLWDERKKIEDRHSRRFYDYIAQRVSTWFDTLAVLSLDRLQLGAYLHAPITVLVSKLLTQPCPYDVDSSASSIVDVSIRVWVLSKASNIVIVPSSLNSGISEVIAVNSARDHDTSVAIAQAVMLPNDVVALSEETSETMRNLLVMQHVQVSIMRHEVPEVSWKVEHQVFLEPFPMTSLCSHRAVRITEHAGTTLLTATALRPLSLAHKSPSWFCLALSVSRRSTPDLVHSSDLLVLLMATVLLLDRLSTLTALYASSSSLPFLRQGVLGA